MYFKFVCLCAQVGDFHGQAAVAIHPLSPLDCMLSVSFNHLDLLGIINTFIPKQHRMESSSGVGKLMKQFRCTNDMLKKKSMFHTKNFDKKNT